MAVQLAEYELTCKCNYKLYDVTLNNTEIETTVTVDPYIVNGWINRTEALNKSHLHRLIIGFDVEWRPNFTSGGGGAATRNPIATIQLCVGNSCLIYQIAHSPNIPRKLRNFLKNETYKFVGVGIGADVEKLWDDYGIEVLNSVDLREWAVVEMGKKELRNVGLKVLVKEILGIEIEKPKSVTMSNWDQRLLSAKQICYACLDAYFSFEIGRVLSAWY